MLLVLHLGLDTGKLIDAAAQAGEFVFHLADRLLRIVELMRGVTAALHEPDAQPDGEHEQPDDGVGPPLDAAAQAAEVVADFVNVQFETGAVVDRVVQVRVGANDLAVGRLQGAQLLGLGLMRVGGKGLVEKHDPDFFAARADVEGFVLRVAATAKTRVRLGRLDAVALADELDDARAGVDAAAQHRAQVALARAEDVLPLGVGIRET